MMQGADPATVRAAIEAGDPLPGTYGFAGTLDGRPVRDVIGRYPLFVDGEAVAARPDELADPTPVEAGTVGGERVWRLPTREPTSDAERARQRLEDALGTATPDPDGTTAVAFSGGVDSGLVATVVEGPLYVAGFPESHDLEAARAGADALDRELRVVELDHDDLRRAVPAVVAATGRTNAMDVAIALPLYLTAERAAGDGIDVLALGQGADELFGGYAKVAKAPDDPRLEADTVGGARREVLADLPDGLERDVLALRAAGVEPCMPLLHDAVVDAALRLEGDDLVADGRRKVTLRRVAAQHLPADIAERDKKAAQYGSLVSRELDRLARQAGFKRRMDDHVRRYVASLCD